MSHHVDTLAPRDAASYAAEAARCLGELDVDGALACYGEAVRLEPRSGVFLDAYGSLLADCGRFPYRRIFTLVWCHGEALVDPCERVILTMLGCIHPANVSSRADPCLMCLDAWPCEAYKPLEERKEQQERKAQQDCAKRCANRRMGQG